MPEFDASKVTAAIAVAAIISPILTAILNNIFQLISKKLDAREKLYKNTVEYKKNILENYLRCAGRCIGYPDEKELRDYYEYYFLSLVYVPDNLKKEMICIHHFVEERNYIEANKHIEVLIPNLQELIKRM